MTRPGWLATPGAGLDRQVITPHPTRQPEPLRPGPEPDARRLAASGVVVDLALGDGLLEVAHAVADRNDVPDADQLLMAS